MRSDLEETGVDLMRNRVNVIKDATSEFIFGQWRANNELSDKKGRFLINLENVFPVFDLSKSTGNSESSTIIIPITKITATLYFQIDNSKQRKYLIKGITNREGT